MMSEPLPPPRRSPQTPLEWALFYASLGWSVVPVRRGEKIPAERWARFQTLPADHAQIMAWFAENPTFGVGLIQGGRSATIVLDFDAASGGLETLAELDARGLPQSVRQFTPGGGVHVVLLHPGRYVPTRKSVRPGMDVRGDGGFIVATPSVHANGREYAWDVDAHPEETPVADCPAWLVDLICGDAPQLPGQPGEVVRVQAAGPLGLPAAERVTDGREQYMRDTILAVCRDLRDRLGRLPDEAELFEAAWPQYAAKVDFSRAGRGEPEFRAKVRYTLGRIQAGAIRGFGIAPQAPEASTAATLAGLTYDPETGEIISDAIGAPGTPGTPGTAKPAIWIDAEEWTEDAIPKRPWLAPGYLMRGAVSALSGQGSGGKSSLVVCWTIALATGQAVGEFRPTGAMRVVNYNVEDDELEQRRRYSAALRASGRTPADVAGQVIRCGPESIGTLFERHPDTGHITPTAAMEALEALCRESGADVLVCDPLAELHNAEENDNTAMRAVVAAFRGLAKRLNIAVLLLHHDRKGNNAPGDMDRLRGASAITGAVRVLLTLTSMSEADAERFGIPPEHRRRHFRIDGAKSNYAIAQEAEWWRLAGYPLANGEEVAACLPWAPPSPFAGLSMTDCIAALDIMHAGTPAGHAWAVAKQTRDDWGGRILTEKHGLTDAQADAILAAWIKSGTVSVEVREGPRRGHPRKAFVVNLSSVSEMRRQKQGETP
jgi:hypothetical protein